MKTPCYVKTGRCCLFKCNNLLGIQILVIQLQSFFILNALLRLFFLLPIHPQIHPTLTALRSRSYNSIYGVRCFLRLCLVSGDLHTTNQASEIDISLAFYPALNFFYNNPTNYLTGGIYYDEQKTFYSNRCDQCISAQL